MSEQLVSDTIFWQWIAGILATVSGGGYGLLFFSFKTRIAIVEEHVKDKCIPRPECDKTHKAVDATLKEVKDLINTMDGKMDTGFSNMYDKIGDVHQRINEGGP